MKSPPATKDPISLIRTTPPTPPWLKEALSLTLMEIATKRDLSTLLRNHRFKGTEADRAAGAIWLGKRLGSVPETERVVVTNGTQNSLFLALATIFGGKGTLLTESLSYYGFRRLAGLLGIDSRPVAMDEDGALPDAFDAACRQYKPKALFLTPTVHNPTTLIMSRERRLMLAEVARRHGVAIIEDDVYGLLPHHAPLPIAALAPDVTWYATGLAKCVSPGLKVGYLLPPTQSALTSLTDKFQVTTTWHVAPLSALVAETWLTDGTAFRILEAVQQEAKARQEMVRDVLAGAQFTSKPEALHLWLSLPERWTQSQFVEAANDVGVVLRPGSMFALDAETAPNAIRIVVGSPETRAELATALKALVPLAQHR